MVIHGLPDCIAAMKEFNAPPQLQTDYDKILVTFHP
jgi:hypothetical protein